MIIVTLCTPNTCNRYFLKALLSEVEVEMAHKSGIQSQLEANNALEMFKQLKAKNLCVLKRSAENSSDHSEEEEEDSVHLVYNLTPPPRKRQHTST